MIDIKVSPLKLTCNSSKIVGIYTKKLFPHKPQNLFSLRNKTIIKAIYSFNWLSV